MGTNPSDDDIADYIEVVECSPGDEALVLSWATSLSELVMRAMRLLLDRECGGMYEADFDRAKELRTINKGTGIALGIFAQAMLNPMVLSDPYWRRAVDEFGRVAAALHAAISEDNDNKAFEYFNKAWELAESCSVPLSGVMAFSAATKQCRHGVVVSYKFNENHSNN